VKYASTYSFFISHNTSSIANATGILWDQKAVVTRSTKDLATGGLLRKLKLRPSPYRSLDGLFFDGSTIVFLFVFVLVCPHKVEQVLFFVSFVFDFCESKKLPLIRPKGLIKETTSQVAVADCHRKVRRGAIMKWLHNPLSPGFFIFISVF